jgi:hypothetical protein
VGGLSIRSSRPNANQNYASAPVLKIQKLNQKMLWFTVISATEAENLMPE